MTPRTILLIVGAAVVALGFALFQYYFKTKYKTSRNVWYTLLRFLTVFTLLVLLINPLYKRKSYFIEKPSLVVAVDNSESVKFLGYEEQAKAAVNRFRESENLNDHFEVNYYQLGTEAKQLDSLNFEDKQTDIAKVFKNLKSIYKGETAPTVLLTDGNQTLGASYLYSTKNYEQRIYTVPLGDTVTYDDLKLGQLNVNRYAYINNQFPVEVFTSYTGNSTQNTNLIVRSGNRIVYRKVLSFSAEKATQVINFLLPAESVGVKQYTVSLDAIPNEKNTTNNSKSFAIEVIDQKTNVALVTSLVHPDIGAFKKSIETNKLRTVTIVSPQEALSRLESYDIMVLYQPSLEFDDLIRAINNQGINQILITGAKTNWRLLNQLQNDVEQEVTRQTEDIQASINSNFSTFNLEPLPFEDYPPLQTVFGDITIKNTHGLALNQSVSGFETGNPVLITTEANATRRVWIFGEGIWRWRAQNYLDNRSFESFDRFVDQLIQYTASKKRKSRFNVDYESFYYGASGIQLSAQYFDKNYVFDNRAEINIEVINKDTKAKFEVPFLLKRNAYEVDLSNLEAGSYQFLAKVEGQGLVRTGNFVIVPFEVEQQFLNANSKDLKQLALQTNGQFVTLDAIDGLIDTLINDTAYIPVQKSKENIVPLIDWRWLLGLLVGLLTLEWFLRKYNGLI